MAAVSAAATTGWTTAKAETSVDDARVAQLDPGDGTDAIPCDDFQYVNNNICLECPTGFTCDGDTKTACAVDKYVDNNECLECPTGFTCDGVTKTGG
ncbi:hypothetical protein JL722_3305 [Aureococcus anophagefferens]|nr:hypothetical protein JL722_3305 [Aureococcus anophagefferens]